MKVAVIGAGTMGAGIAQVAATAGADVWMCDSAASAIERASLSIKKGLARLAEKGALKEEEVFSRIRFVNSLAEIANADLVIEAIIEDRAVKEKLFAEIENLVGECAILATNTSSLSVTALGASLKRPERFLGVHFFNPAPLMPLVEIVPGLETAPTVVSRTRQIVDGWSKVTVLAKDTPGFIVNRVARPFYGEVLRIYEEGLANFAAIDAAMREVGFKMGPFELMDLIGSDINFTVTKTVFEAQYFDPRYRPALTQQRMVESGRLGRKSGRGYYEYSEGNKIDQAPSGLLSAAEISERILLMLINEAADAVQFGVAEAPDIDLAMTKGVNYPKGLLAWADEIGLRKVLDGLDALSERYREDRYRASALIRDKVKRGEKFHG